MPVLDKQQVVKELRQVLVEELFVEVPEGEINLEAGLASDLGIDSVGFIELIAILEEKYSIKIESDEASRDNFHNLDVLSNFIIAKAAGRA